MAIQKLAHVALQRLYSRNEFCEFYFMRRVAVRSVVYASLRGPRRCIQLFELFVRR